MIKKAYRKIMSKSCDNVYITVQYIRKFKRLPNIIRPKTFAEKIYLIKVSNWLLSKSDYVDKYKVRRIIKDIIGEEYLTNLYGVYNNSKDINFDELPKSFVLKLNNGSGYNLIVKDKDNIDQKKVKKEIDEWLKSNYYIQNREKQYKNVEQLVICEEYLEDDSGELRDYKLFCFDGKVKLIQVDTGRNSNHIQNFYDINWNKLNITYLCEKNNTYDKKPILLEKIIYLAEKLSKDIPFVRVDFYYVNNKIYFGELTLTPNNGIGEFKPSYKDREIANWIDEKKYKTSIFI